MRGGCLASESLDDFGRRGQVHDPPLPAKVVGVGMRRPFQRENDIKGVPEIGAPWFGATPRNERPRSTTPCERENFYWTYDVGPSIQGAQKGLKRKDQGELKDLTIHDVNL